MSRTWTLTWYVTRDLFRSLAGVVPLAAALAFGLIAFEYGMDQAQFMTVAGLGTGALCFLTTLLLANRANRASSYPLVARLRWREELLLALTWSSLGITALLALLIAGANLLAGRLVLEGASALWVVPTWLPLWILAAALALPLSGLVGRGGSHMFGWVLLAGLLIANERKVELAALDFDWLSRAVSFVLWPVSALLMRASGGIHDRSYILALILTLGYAVLAFSLAASTFGSKDLLWTE